MSDRKEIDGPMVGRKVQHPMQPLVVERSHGNCAEPEAHRLQEEVLRRVARLEVDVPLRSRSSIFGCRALIDRGDDEDRRRLQESLLVEGGPADLAPQVSFQPPRQPVPPGLIVKETRAHGQIDLEGIQSSGGRRRATAVATGDSRRGPEKLREHLRREGLPRERTLRATAGEGLLERERPADLGLG
jgi:hypothetical protein